MSPDEMGVDLMQLCQKLNQDKNYHQSFQKAFATDSITSAHISRALAQYLRSIISADSKYDSVRLGLAHFSTPELEGEKVFEKNCASCHTPPLFTDNQFHHNGLVQIYFTDHLALSTGRFRITRDSSDLGKYKTPSLRNLKYTAPYMHDGRFSSLPEVLHHYQAIDASNQNTDSLVRLIEYSDAEKLVLLDFLETLNGNVTEIEDLN